MTTRDPHHVCSLIFLSIGSNLLDQERMSSVILNSLHCLSVETVGCIAGRVTSLLKRDILKDSPLKFIQQLHGNNWLS